VKGLTTDVNGVVKAEIWGISSVVDGKFVTLIPLSKAGTTADSTNDMGVGLYGWVCGSSVGAMVTDVGKQYLPGSCRGV
jgi:hypothetical protein